MISLDTAGAATYVRTHMVIGMSLCGGYHEEIESWARLPPDHYEAYFDEDDQLLNEFEMMWAMRDRFPLHFFVFKQVASHLAHEANVEQVFSRAGGLTDPHMDPTFLASLVMAAVNKKAYCPALAAIKDKLLPHGGWPMRVSP